MITLDAARDLARASLGEGRLEVLALRGGWRFWLVPSARELGAEHVAVRGTTGDVRSFAAAAPDELLERWLAS